MDTLWQDVRYAIRWLTRYPGFTLVTLLALALGIGANTAIVSIANAMLLRPLPVREPATLVRIFSGRDSATPLIDLLEYARASKTLEGIAPFQQTTFSLRRNGAAAESVSGEFVGGDYFDLVGASVARGRTFLPDEGRTPGSGAAAVLSHRGWQRHFDGNPGVVGQQVFLNNHAFTIVGVMDDAFTGLSGPLVTDLWVPVSMQPALYPRSNAYTVRDAFYALAIGRVRRGVGIGQVQAELDSLHQQWERDLGPDRRSNLVVYSARTLFPDQWAGVAIFVAILFGLSAIVLCIACLNVANLLLARSSARLGELGIRLAIGASQGRIVRQLLTESVVLALGGGALGVALAYWITRAIGRWTPPVPVAIELRVAPDWMVLLVTFGVALMAALLCGLMPAWSAARRAVLSSLRQNATRGSGRGVSRLRASFLVAQVSLSLVLLVMAGLLVRSLGHAQRIDVGFEPEGVLIATLDLEVGNYTPERGLALYRALVEQVGALPHVQNVSMLDAVPLTGAVRGTPILKEGETAPPADRSAALPTINQNAVGSGYFETIGIRRLAGRDFDSRDSATAPQVAIVNETLARRFWPGESALGKRLRRYDSRNPDAPLIEIVGLVADSKYVSVGEEPRAFMYRPMEQTYTPRGTLIARVNGDPVTLVPAVREALKRLDPGLPMIEARLLTDATSISLLPLRMATVFLGVLGLLVLALAAIGLYGVLSFLVRLRTKEIGIRMALGADRSRVIRTVMSDALFWLGWGVGAGLVLAFVLAPLVASLLYGVPPRDAITFALVTPLLVGVGAAASLIPAVRASRVDPLAALRVD